MIDVPAEGAAQRSRPVRKAESSRDAAEEIWEQDEQPPPKRSHRTAPRIKSSSKLPLWLGIGAGIAVLLLIGLGVIVAVTIAVFRNIAKNPPGGVGGPPIVAGAATEPFPLATIGVPIFPELGTPSTVPGTQVSLFDVSLASVNAGSVLPGAAMRLRLYLPPGNHAERSLGCVLVAPAGTNLLVGNNLDSDDYHAETLPYARAGYAVVFYSLDGGLAGEMESASDAQIAEGYRKFAAAHAGLVNARNALEFVLARVPQVDPQRVFSAGHSSAAVLSLLFAEHEPRLKGCIAYAPASDVETRLADAVNNRGVQRLLPGVTDFVKRSSPRTHMASFRSPVFLFHAVDDSNEPIATSQRFARDLQQLGKAVTFEQAQRGDHYQSMIDQGIPKAIEWLRRLPGEQAATQ